MCNLINTYIHTSTVEQFSSFQRTLCKQSPLTQTGLVSSTNILFPILHSSNNFLNQDRSYRCTAFSSDLFRDYYILSNSPFPRCPNHGHDRPCRRDVGRVFLADVRPDSPSRRRIPSCYCPGPGRGAAVEMGQRSVHQAHTTPVNSVHISAPCADMFGDSVCAREADDTAVESWYVPLY